MDEKFSGLIYSNFKKNQGWLVGVISLGTSIILWVFKPDSVVSSGLTLTLLIVAFFFVIIFADSGHEIFNKYLNLKNTTKLPRIERVKSRGSNPILIAEPSNLFYKDMLVSIYLIDETDFEEFIGFGHIINIQENKQLQIKIMKTIDSFEEKLKRIIANDNDILDKIMIKPHLTDKFLDIIIKEE